MLSFLLFFSVCLSSTFRDYCCVLFFWTWGRLCFRYWSTAVEVAYVICEATKHEIKSCNVEILVTEIMCLDTLKYPVRFLSNWRNAALSMTQFGMALSAQHGRGRSFCSWSAAVTYQITEVAHRYLTEIEEPSLILGAREFYKFGENWRKDELAIISFIFPAFCKIGAM